MRIFKRFTAYVCFVALFMMYLPLLQVNAVNTSNSNMEKIDVGGYTITTKKTTVESKQVCLVVDEGIYLPNNALSEIGKLMTAIEQKTNLSFYPTGKEEVVTVWVERNGYELGREYYGAWGWEAGCSISPGDLLVPYGERAAITHELLHCIYFRNGKNINLPIYLTEGFSTYFSSQILDYDNNMFNLTWISDNYLMNDTVVNEKNAEKLISSYEDWDAYLLGYNFYYYLHQEVDAQAFQKIMKECNKTYEEYEEVSIEKSIAIVKKLFGTDIFKRFGKWYSNNKPQPHTMTDAKDFTKKKGITIFPFVNEDICKMYYPLIFTYKKSLMLDLSKGFEYLQSYLKIKPTGIYGTVSVTENTTFTFYDSSHVYMKKIVVKAG